MSVSSASVPKIQRGIAQAPKGRPRSWATNRTLSTRPRRPAVSGRSSGAQLRGPSAPSTVTREPTAPRFGGRLRRARRRSAGAHPPGWPRTPERYSALVWQDIEPTRECRAAVASDSWSPRPRARRSHQGPGVAPGNRLIHRRAWKGMPSVAARAPATVLTSGHVLGRPAFDARCYRRDRPGGARRWDMLDQRPLR